MPRNLQRQRWEEIRVLVEAGECVAEIGRRLGVDTRSVRYAIKAMGLVAVKGSPGRPRLPVSGDAEVEERRAYKREWASRPYRRKGWRPW